MSITHRFCSSLTLCVLLAGLAFGQEHQNITQVESLYERWHYGHDLCVKDTLVFVACGYNGVLVIDVSDPENPEYINNFNDNPLLTDRISVSGDLLFTGDHPGCPSIYDISDVNNIVRLSMIEEIFTERSDYYYRDGVLFISSGMHSYTLYAVDIRQPESPRIIREFEACSDASDLFSIGNSLFCVTRNPRVNGWVKLDISDPLNPVAVDSVDFGDSFWNGTCVFAQDNRAYISHAAGMLIVELDQNLDVIDSVFYENDYASYMSIMDKQDDILFGLGGDGIQLFDVSDIHSVEHIGSILNGYAITTFQICDELLYAFDRDEFIIVDIENPLDPRVLSRIDDYTDGICMMNLNDTQGILVNSDQTCRILDLSNQGLVSELSSCYLEHYPQSITTSDHGFVTAGKFGGGCFGYDIYESAENNQHQHACSVQLGEIDTTPDINNMEVIDNKLVILEAKTGVLYTSDISDVNSPRLMSSLELHNQEIVNMRILRDQQLVMLTNDSLFIIDVTDPQSPESIAGYRMQSDFPYISAYGLAVKYPYVFVTILESDMAWNAALKVFDMSDPDDIYEVAQFNDLDYIFTLIPDIDVSGDYAVISNYDDGINVYNISNPESIHHVGYFNTPGIALYSKILDNKIFTFDITSFGVYDYSQAMSIPETETQSPTAFILSPVFPNPFNSSTNISFDLHGQCHVQLTVFDNLGRRVTDLVNGGMSAGKHSIVWDAGNQPSGQYHCVLKAGQKKAAQNLILVK